MSASLLRALGLMSGTSLDGIDVALIETDGETVSRFGAYVSREYSPTERHILRGAVNAAGLDFYDRLVDALLGHGVEPMATLYHWDLPAALDDIGGWLNPDIAKWFAEYGRLHPEVRMGNGRSRR